MGEPAVRRWTIDEFLAWEATQEDRYEYVDGAFTAMVGGTLDHNRIALNLAVELSLRLRDRGCDVLSQGMRLRTDTAVLYPDVVVACGDFDGAARTLDQAVLVAEVLSPSTEHRDRDPKWRAYQELPGLRHYLLVAQDAARVELFSRGAAGWEPTVLAGLDAAIRLDGLDVELPLAEIYRATSVSR